MIYRQPAWARCVHAQPWQPAGGQWWARCEKDETRRDAAAL